MHELAEPIVRSNNFKEILDEMQGIWEQEQQRRQEFYEKITPSDKWEFINGEIVVHSPAKKRHLDATKNLFTLLNPYVTRKHLGTAYQEKAMIVTSRNDYEPDIVFFNALISEQLKDDQWQFPIPDFVVEVLSRKTAANDKGIKLKDYESHGVKEYWIIAPKQQTVEQRTLNENGKFDLLAKKTIEDRITSQVVPGFSIPVEAIFDEQLNLEVLLELLDS